MTLLVNPERLAHEAIAAALRPPAPVDYLAWAVANRRAPPQRTRL
jgi:hypothetical protein